MYETTWAVITGFPICHQIDLSLPVRYRDSGRIIHNNGYGKAGPVTEMSEIRRLMRKIGHPFVETGPTKRKMGSERKSHKPVPKLQLL